MRTSEEKIAELHRRMDELHRSRIHRRYLLICSAAYAGCLVVLGVLATGVSKIPVQAGIMMSGGVTASIFGNLEALGYVVVMLLALCLGVIATIFCFRLKRYMEKEERNDFQK